MAAAAMTGGVLEPPVAARASRVRLHAKGVRLVVVHHASEPSRLIAQLRETRFEVNGVSVGRPMVDQLVELAPTVVVIDHSKASFDVARLCHDVSESLMARVVVVCTCELDESDKLEVAVLDAGADDFVTSSSSKEVLFARIRAVLRQRPAPAIPLSRMTLGDVQIDLQAHALLIAGAPVKCSPLQFILLVVLAKRPNQAVDRDTLLADVWGAAPDSVDPRRVRIAISMLRRVLGSGPQRPRIETVSHVGYRLAVDGMSEISV